MESLNENKGTKKKAKKKKEKKTKIKVIRLSENELKEIKKNAKENLMNFSQFLIFSSLKKRADIKQQPLYKELVTQIAWERELKSSQGTLQKLKIALLEN